MAGLTDYSATNLLSYIVGKVTMPTLPSVYVALFTTAPTSNSGVTGAVEVSGTGYARVATTPASWATAQNSVGSEPGPQPASITNSATIQFPGAIDGWGTVVAVGAFDALGGGNLLAWDYLGNFPWVPFTGSLASPSVLTAPAHGYSNADSVVVSTKFGGALPSTGGSWSGVLVVAGATTDTFTGGVNSTSTGSGMVRKVLTQSIIQNTQVSYQAGTLILTSA